jgi:predicted DNA-binding antitoxin AbrB/MazE fold protein
MEQVLEAIYRRGVFTPLRPLTLPEEQRVTIILQFPIQEKSGETLAAWRQVYAGFSEESVAEVEAIALDRSHFMRGEA